MKDREGISPQRLVSAASAPIFKTCVLLPVHSFRGITTSASCSHAVSNFPVVAHESPDEELVADSKTKSKVIIHKARSISLLRAKKEF
jgi:hypothetical protein